jgi:hypothetical protein
MGSDYFIQAVRFATWVFLRTVNLIPESSDCPSANFMRWRATNYGAAVIGLITDCDDR